MATQHTKTILITGASDGIGAASARQLAERGHRVLVAGRSREKTEAVARETGATPFIADFGSLADVRRLADEVKQHLATSDSRGTGLDVLANNAGGIFGTRQRTEDGYEKTFQVNHLAPFLLTHELMDDLIRARGSVINTSSIANTLFGRIDLDDLANDKKYSANKAYGDAKLANILFTRGLHERFHDDGVSSVAFHPGTVATNFASDTTSLMRFLYRTPLKRFFLITTEKGGDNLTFFADGTPGETWLPGMYYDEKSLSTSVNAQVHDEALVAGLWDRSAEMVGVG
ncbi:SDR family NAD(P)-dependent oxidoreductase [Marisediminicola sp. LYQ134]|uniref:SDR family NAD(P)-dependent oxidoreductase n=1 Tax=Marisediminicola sp. LYQ134 TaxID=3391061 RepID=UPI003983B75D